MTPDVFTNQELFLEVGDGHQIYVHDWGKSDASLPILFLHSGPGGGVNDRHKQRFIPEKQRVIFYDQRGSGRSLPTGSIDHNTTQDLIADIECIADKLSLDRFLITGGSWGSCLALAYGLEHPERIAGMVLSGIFTGSQSEADYIDNGGFRSHFPDVWQAYVDRAPKKYAENPSEFHYAQAFGDDLAAAKESIYAYAELESALLSLDDRHTPANFEDFDENGMKIELHYLKHRCFMPDRYILDNAHGLTMPIWLVQGRYDMVCPPKTAYELHQILPHSTLLWTTAGHANDRANYDVMRTVLLALTEQLS